ncbi:MAG: type I methionyl aminopeptidase, partial [Candidatus Portnoybacteria bacterium RIFCSPLOWO2_01_FULL_38_39]
DIVSLDLGILYKGFYLDMAITVPVGRISPEAGRLIRITKKALKRAISRVKPGKHIGDISQAVESYVEGQGFNVVRQLCGHGIGRKLHEAPEIPNFGKRHKGPELKPGMVLAIEPMVTMGDWKLKKSKDGFGFETIDGFLSAHFEQTVAVTEKGEVLTKL